MTPTTGTHATGIAVLDTVAFDAADIEKSARFWETLLGGSRSDADDEWITVVTPDRWGIAFQLAPDHIAPDWPSGRYPQHLHLDIRVPDLAASTTLALGLGASMLRTNDTWNTLADPAGHPFDLVANDEVEAPTVFGVMFDVPDSSASAAFWSSLLGDPVVYDQDGMAMLGGPRPILFQQIDDYRAPHWPDPSNPQQAHLDLEVDDLDTAEAAALALGARRLPGSGETFRVFADPNGHPFCLCG
jgi:catechol 2,3-dioxygenase-like lactoylglutathione lyase family enzyme